MSHPLEIEFGLSSDELLDAIQKKFRAKVTLAGAVAELLLGRHIASVQQRGIIERFEEYDEDGKPDYALWLPSVKKPLTIECKNVRNVQRKGGILQVEVQKTRAAKGDPTSRFYDTGHFDILGVCLGKITGNWREFMFCWSRNLAGHKNYVGKIEVFHALPAYSELPIKSWYGDLGELLLSKISK